MNAFETLVTGATGFIGRHLVDRLIGEGEAVVAIVRPGSQVPQHWLGRVTEIKLIDWSRSAIEAALQVRSIGAVYHLAAYGVHPQDRDVDTMLHINAELPIWLVELARRWRASVVAVGSSAEYARTERQVPLTERGPLEVGKLYGTSKAAGGLLASAVAVDSDVAFRYLRLFNVYGPGEAAHRLLPSLVRDLTRNRRVPLSDGRQVRDFVLVDDVVDALIMAGSQVRQEGKARTAIWNVCSGKGHSVRDFAVKVADTLGRPRGLLGFGDLAARDNDVAWLVGDGELISEELGWRPQYSFDTGVTRAALNFATQQVNAVNAG